VYLVLLFGSANGAPLPEVDYVPILLWTIAGAVVGSVIGRIVVEIVHARDAQQADERDRDIGRLGEYVGGTILGIGMVGPFILALIEADQFWIANAMYLVFVVASVVGTTIKLIVYRRGF
jgi:predicted membrane protein